MKSHVIIIKETSTTIDIRARVGEEYKENNIQLSAMLAYYWENKLSVIKNLLELIETVIKRTINEVFPHENLHLEYEIITDKTIDDATNLEIKFKEIKADNTLFDIDGKILSLKGINKENNPKDSEDSIQNFKENIIKDIKTEKAVSFKEFARMQNNKQ